MQAVKLSRSTLADDAYRVVRQVLLDGERFAPGEKLSVEALTRELGVSRSPVWNAIARLEAEGILEVRPRQGVFLIGFSPEKVRALFEAREALEGMAARLAAARIQPATLDALSRSLDDQRRIVATGDRARYTEETQHFHGLITAAAGNPVIEHQLQRIYAQVAAMCSRRRTDAELDDHVDQHAAMVAALAAGDGDAAEQLSRAHARHLVEAALAGLDRPMKKAGRA
jgi:DNA-binding GntR family transcriptional regulator